MSKRNDRITVRLSTEEKQCIEEAAMKLGINSSQYIRTIALNKNKLIFLNESGSIANAITKLQIDFDRATRTKALSSENEQYMLKT